MTSSLSEHDDDRDFRPEAPLSSDELERVIRRAAELQTVRETLPERLDDEEVVRIGAEVGLQETYLRRALLELRAEALVPAPPADIRLPSRLWGVAFVQADRVVPGAPHDVQDRLEDYLSTGESLRQIRSRTGLSTWEPASDLVSELRRGLDIGGRGFALARARRISVSIQALESERSLVTITADLRNRRLEHAGGWYFGAGAGTVGITIGLAAAAGLPFLLVGPLVAGGLFGGGTALARHTLRSEREKIELAVQGLLDRLERGGRIRPGRPGILDRIQGLIAEEQK